jgi:hypothetical protein
VTITSAGVATVGRLGSTRAWRRFTTDVTGPGWVRLADRLDDPAGLDGWLASELAGTALGHRDLAGALVAYRLSGSLAELAIIPLLTERRALVLSPEDLWLLFADDGARIEAVGLPSPTVAVLADDPDAGRPGTVVVDADELPDVLADGLVSVFSGVAAAVRARAPFGLAGIWGTLADHLADVAMRWSREAGGAAADADRAWNSAAAVIETLAARPGVGMRGRPHRMDVTCDAGSGSFITRGTCCLIYKRHSPGSQAEQIASAACSSCPLRSADDRRALFVRHLSR